MGTKAPDKMLSRMAYAAELQAILEPARVEPRFKTKRDCDESTFNGSAGYCQACYARQLRRRHRHKQRTCAGCQATFTTTRTDARFCSNACRQKEHRRRVTEKRSSTVLLRVAVTA
jgi:hypothetical protein